MISYLFCYNLSVCTSFRPLCLDLPAPIHIPVCRSFYSFDLFSPWASARLTLPAPLRLARDAFSAFENVLENEGIDDLWRNAGLPYATFDAHRP